MKHKDLTKGVMSKIARYETDRIHTYRIRIRVVLAVLGVATLASLAVTVRDLYSMQAFDLLTLFAEDRQIIEEFWQDTLSTFWQFVPPVWFWGVILCLLCLGGMLVVTHKRRLMNIKKLSQLTKYIKSVKEVI
jgi:hypothetical protein